MRSILLRAYFLCICLLFSNAANADFLNSSLNTRLIDMNQSQTYRLELRVAPLEAQPVYAFKPGIKLAKVRFITDGSVRTDFGNQDFSISEKCASQGYKVKPSSCASGTYPGKKCPYGDEFVDKCYGATDWCKNNGYPITSCISPMYPTTVCPYDDKYYKSCAKDNKQACEDNEYYTSCPTGKVTDETVVCPYDGSYKGCVCNPCDGYDYTASEANEQGYHASTIVCNSCGTMKYKRVENNCTGYKLCEYGGNALDVCWSGSTKYFKECDSNCEKKCTLLTCPVGMFCEYESCTKKWCVIGCGNGKIDIDGFCKRPNTDCENLGYSKPLSACAGRFALGCPFDSSKYHCF